MNNTKNEREGSNLKLLGWIEWNKKDFYVWNNLDIALAFYALGVCQTTRVVFEKE